MHLQGQKKGEKRHEYDDRKGAAHGKEHPCNRAHSDEEPEPRETVYQTENEYEYPQHAKEQEREPRAGARPRLLAGWVWPHQPGIASCEPDECQTSHDHLPWGDRLSHHGGQGKDEADEPGMLIEPPKLEGDSAGGDQLL